MCLNTIKVKLKGKYWLTVGLLFYIGTVISSIIRSLEPASSFDIISMILDWFSASIIYFFIGALVGLIVDCVISKLDKKKIKLPLWAWLTIIFWIVGSLFLAISSNNLTNSLTTGGNNVGIATIVFFPLAYGIFFVGSAFVFLMPDYVAKLPYSQLVFDVVIVSMFSAWLWLEAKYASSTTINSTTFIKIIRRVLLIILFLILSVGLVSCASLYLQVN